MGGSKGKIDRGLASGSTSMLLLKLLEKEDMYGYQMIEELESQSNNVFTLKAGTLYPILHGLEKQGSIISYEVESPEGRNRRYYSLTSDGKALLEEKKAEWKRYTGAVNKVLGGALGSVFSRGGIDYAR